jgi:hypothetical protein
MKKSLYLLVLSVVAMVGSVLWLRWTHNAIYFLAFLGSLTLFLLSSGDYVKTRWGIGRKGVPASVHALAFSLLAFGVLAGIYGIGNPAYSLLDLAVPPFFMAGCVYAAYLLVGRGRLE